MNMLALLLVGSSLILQTGAPTLEKSLPGEDPVAMARAVKLRGDAARGAVVFHQPQNACVTCHDQKQPLGPDLTKLGKDVTDTYLIESILIPSHAIKKGFETVSLVTTDGKVVSGLLAAERVDAVDIRDPAHPEKLITVPKVQIEARKNDPKSIMPPGLVNGLASRQQFLDLISYLRAVADGGADVANRLKPDPQLLVARVEEYEKNIDHAGLISRLGKPNFEAGREIYERICMNCHGTADQPGTLPTSIRFASGAFKNGSDPYSMYKTLTHGYSQMAAQTSLVPRQKYDVIHYIREDYLKRWNATQYKQADASYLATLPKGSSRGPNPIYARPWLEMDYGQSLMASYEVGQDGTNFAYKGIAVRLDPGSGGIAAGRRWMVYDHDTMRLAAAWSGNGFIDWHGINFDGRHQIHPKIVGNREVVNSPGPGWAKPGTESFIDPRDKGRDGRPYGPLPKSWLQYKGLYRWRDRVSIAYKVGSTEILEQPGEEVVSGHNIYKRTIEIAAHDQDLWLWAAPADRAVACRGGEVVVRDGAKLVRVPAHATGKVLVVLTAKVDQNVLTDFAKNLRSTEPLIGKAMAGTDRRYPEVLTSFGITGKGDGPFAVDVLTLPEKTPWKSQMRLTGLDFLPDGKTAVVCDWDGDVWRVEGFDDPDLKLTWRRIASGLFQPLGLKVVDGVIYVTCRDQIAILRDYNNDGETDFVECFNSDHQVTEHFHEFAMDLQVDAKGNFYYAKAGRHAKTALVPQHGTLLRVSRDGSKTDILARGFRAPNGVCVNPDGTFFLTDQEGFWLPKNRINWVKEGGFYGNMWGYTDQTDTSDAAMEPPICWVTNAVDRSPSEIMKVTSPKWGPLQGSLLNLSYGYGKIYVIPHEIVGKNMQGGVSPLPLDRFPTGVMRGRFRESDGQLYALGMYAWAGDQQAPGGFYRVRATGKPAYLPIGLKAKKDGVEVTFSNALDPTSVQDRAHFQVKTWTLKRSANYGSQHYNEAPSEIKSTRLSDDRKSVFLEIPSIKPTMCMEISYQVRGEHGEIIEGFIDNTIHELK